LRVYTRFMKSAAQPTFDPMILWISWFEPHAKATLQKFQAPFQLCGNSIGN
jgi:hypothetical protein